MRKDFSFFGSPYYPDKDAGIVAYSIGAIIKEENTMAKYMTIDGIRVEFTDERNILQVIRKAGIHLPTFCYYSDLSIYGACRMWIYGNA